MMKKKVSKILKLEADFSILCIIFIGIIRRLKKSEVDFEYSIKDKLLKEGLLSNINMPNKELLEITSCENDEKLYWIINESLMTYLDEIKLKSKVNIIYDLGYAEFEFKINDIVFFGDGDGRRIKEILFSRNGDRIYFINESSLEEEANDNRIIVYEDSLLENKVINDQIHNRLFAKNIKFSLIYDKIEQLTNGKIKGKNEKNFFYKIHL